MRIKDAELSKSENVELRPKGAFSRCASHALHQGICVHRIRYFGGLMCIASGELDTAPAVLVRQGVWVVGVIVRFHYYIKLSR